MLCRWSVDCHCSLMLSLLPFVALVPVLCCMIAGWHLLVLKRCRLSLLRFRLKYTNGCCLAYRRRLCLFLKLLLATTKPRDLPSGVKHGPVKRNTVCGRGTIDDAILALVLRLFVPCEPRRSSWSFDVFRPSRCRVFYVTSLQSLPFRIVDRATWLTYLSLCLSHSLSRPLSLSLSSSLSPSPSLSIPLCPSFFLALSISSIYQSSWCIFLLSRQS